MYNTEPLEIMESFKYLGLEVHSNHKWDECSTRCLEAGKRVYYPFGNICRGREIKCWVLNKYHFDTLATLACLYGVELWGDYIPVRLQRV